MRQPVFPYNTRHKIVQLRRQTVQWAYPEHLFSFYSNGTFHPGKYNWTAGSDPKPQPMTAGRADRMPPDKIHVSGNTVDDHIQKRKNTSSHKEYQHSNKCLIIIIYVHLSLFVPNYFFRRVKICCLYTAFHPPEKIISNLCHLYVCKWQKGISPGSYQTKSPPVISL